MSRVLLRCFPYIINSITPNSIRVCVCVCVSVCVCLGPHPWHMEVPRLEVKSELQLPAYTTAAATGDPKSSLQPAPQLMATLDP